MSRFLKEDATIYNAQRQQMGQKKSEDLPKPNKVSDMVTPDDNHFAPKNKPYPLDRFDAINTDVFIGILNLRKIIDTAKNNPELETRHNKQFKLVNDRLEQIGEMLVELSKLVDTIG